MLMARGYSAREALYPASVTVIPVGMQSLVDVYENSKVRCCIHLVVARTFALQWFSAMGWGCFIHVLISFNRHLAAEPRFNPSQRMYPEVTGNHAHQYSIHFVCNHLLLQAQPGEMALWDSLLPVAVERARRTYTHTAECTYTTPGGSGRTLLCSCGQGEDLPSEFEESITQVRSPESSVHPLFYRAALSPLFAPAEAFSVQCGKCGKGGKALMKCARCHKVAYCSKDCQRLDWKVHKRTCSA